MFHSIVQLVGCMIHRRRAGNCPPQHLHNTRGFEHETCGHTWKNVNKAFLWKLGQLHLTWVISGAMDVETHGESIGKMTLHFRMMAFFTSMLLSPRVSKASGDDRWLSLHHQVIPGAPGRRYVNIQQETNQLRSAF